MARPPALPASFERTDLEQAGFAGWKRWAELQSSDYDLPKKPLCYVIYRESTAAPMFRPNNPGGRFKGQDPTVPVAKLAAKWVDGVSTINRSTRVGPGRVVRGPWHHERELVGTCCYRAFIAFGRDNSSGRIDATRRREG